MVDAPQFILNLFDVKENKGMQSLPNNTKILIGGDAGPPFKLKLLQRNIFQVHTPILDPARDFFPFLSAFSLIIIFIIMVSNYL
jgi:hypothetical protein